jgi:hypothetical protein
MHISFQSTNWKKKNQFPRNNKKKKKKSIGELAKEAICPFKADVFD